MNNKIMKKKYGQVQEVIFESSYKKGLKVLSKKRDHSTISRLKSIIEQLRTFDIDTQYKNHVLSDGRYELHIKEDILLVYKYNTNVLYVDLVLLDLTNHKGLNDSLDISQEDDTKKSSGVKSNGIYSVLNNKWIKEPTQSSIPDIDKEEFEKLFKEWEDKYFDLLEELKSSKVSKDRPKSELVNDFIEDIYDLRKSSIDKEGEYGLKNLVFKEFRNLGYLDNLKDLKNELKSKELSLESLNKLCESINRGDETTIQGLKKLLEE